MSAQNASTDTSGASRRPPDRRRARRIVAIVAAVALVGIVLGISLSGIFSAGAHASVNTNCVAAPHLCGLPDATNTGVPSGTTLKTVPGQVSSGPGWSYNTVSQVIQVTGNGAVLSGLSIAGNVNITASNVTIKDDQVVIGGNFGISLRHTANVIIENSTISGQNSTTGRVAYAIDDIYGDSTGMVFKNNNISDWRVGINAGAGQVTGNYIHDPGYIAGDHTDGIYDAAGTQPMTISGNTVLNNIGQACAIYLQSNSGRPVANKTITNNLLAGGDYVIYAGGFGNDSSHIIIQGNRFGQQYYPTSGRYGPVAQFQANGTGNTWSGNVWTGHLQPYDIRPGKVRDNRQTNTVPLP